MRNFFTKNWLSYALLGGLGLGLFTACDSDDESSVDMPEASFGFTLNGQTMTFENTSLNATSYSWDFGDDATSTEESPSHEYASVGAYVVTLTATNEAGSDETTSAVEVKIEILIDGDHSDWDDVEAISVKNADNSGILQMVKATSDLNNIYIYIQGDDAFHGFVQMYFDADDDPTTGYIPTDHPVSGADFELDASATYAEFHQWTPAVDPNDQALWQFDTFADDDDSTVPIVDGEDGGLFTGSEAANNGIEFSISRELVILGLGNVETIRFAVGDVDVSDGGWNEQGYLPNPGEDYIVLDLFK